MKQIAHRVLHALASIALLGVMQLNPSRAQNPTTTPQAAPPSMWLVITQVSVKPEMIAEFQNFMKNTTNPGIKERRRQMARGLAEHELCRRCL